MDKPERTPAEPLPSGRPRKLRPAPSLQVLVQKYGGYHRITPQAWAEYDRAVAQWKEDVRLGFALEE